MSSKIKLLLTISIILNVLFAGLFIGHLGKRQIFKWGMKRHFAGFTEKLSPEKQDLIMTKMGELRSKNIKTRKQISKTTTEIAEVLKSSEFDENLYDQKVEQLHELHSQMAKSLSIVIKELAVQLTPEEREVLAEMLNKRQRKHLQKSFRKH